MKSQSDKKEGQNEGRDQQRSPTLFGGVVLENPMAVKKQDFDLEQAKLDPGSVFSAPEDILEEPSLNKAQKIDLLKRWKYDAQRVLDSGSEGMAKNLENDLLRRIALALEYLEQDG